MILSGARQAAIRWLDLLAGVLVLVCVQRLLLYTEDMAVFVTFAAKLRDPALFAKDLCYSAQPDPRHDSIAFLLAALPQGVSPFGLMAAMNVVSYATLLAALRRLATQAAGMHVSAIMPALLLAGVRNVLFADYFLLWRGFSTHALSVAIGLLALSLILDNRKLAAACTLLPAVLFNARLGVFAAGIVFLAWFAGADRKSRTWAAAVASLLVLAVACMLYRTHHSSSHGVTIDEIVRIWTYARAPWHFLPSFRPPWEYVNVVLVAGLIVCFYRSSCSRDSRLLCLLAWSALACVLAGIVNNHYFLVPIVVLVNPLEMGLFTLAIFHALAAAFLTRKLAEGRPLSTLAILATWDLQTRAWLMLVLWATDYGFRHTGPRRGWAKDLLALAACATALGLVYALVRPRWLETAFPYVSLHGPLRTMLFAAPLLLGLRLFRAAPSPVAMGAVIGAVVAWSAWAGSIFYPFEVDRRQVEVCDFLRDSTPVDACILVDPDWADFQFRSRRSAFATLKAAPFTRWSDFPEWFRRLQALGYYPPGVEPDQLDHVVLGDPKAYGSLQDEDFRRVCQQWRGISHIVVKKPVDLALPCVFENDSHRVFALGPAELHSVADASNASVRSDATRPRSFRLPD